MPQEFRPQATSTDGQPSWIAPVKPVVPDHELVRRIGGGSYGDVWLARTTVGTWRAVKVVFRDRFRDTRPYEREFHGIQTFEPLSRANEAFVDILQIGRNDVEDYFYYVMELADDAVAESDPSPVASPQSGTHAVHSSRAFLHAPDSYVPKTLSKVLLQRGRLPVSECLELGLTLNLGLAHLHKAGLIHRDIKPSNIIFVGGVPKLADIGLVIDMGEARSFVGTEGFIPPEGPNSAQADLYSLGKVLYEAGMGKDRKDFPEPLTQIADAPDAAQLLEFNAVLLKACAASREERYQSAEAMNADLALLQSGGSVRRQRKLAGQLRLVQRMVTLTALLALVIGAGWWWQARQTAIVQELANQKTSLAGTLTRLDAENRNRIVRLDIANGNRLLDQGDPAGALLWFADALPLLKDKPIEESVHRIRIQQTLDQTPRVLRIFPHDSGVVGGAFSPDGRLITTATQDGDIRLWDAQDGRLVWGPRRLPNAARYLRFSKDGQKLLASSSWEQGMFNGDKIPNPCFAVLDARTGQLLFPSERKLAHAFTNVVCAHFSPDDRWLAVAEVNHVIRVYDWQTGHQAAELRGHADEVRFLSFSADGSLMASASIDRTVRLWHLPSGTSAREPLEHRWPVVRVLLTADGKRLVSASFAKPGGAGLGEESDSEIQAWDFESGQKLGAPLPGGEWLKLFVAPGEQDRFFSNSKGGNLRSFRFVDREEDGFQSRLGSEHSWAFTQDRSQVALSGEFVAQVFDARTGNARTGVLRHGHWSVNSVGFGPDERQLLTTSIDGCARLWDLRPAPSRFVTERLPAPIAFAYTPAMVRQLGRRSGGFPVNLKDQTVRIYDEELHEMERFSSEIPGKEASNPTRAWRSNMWAILHFDQGSLGFRTIVLWQGDTTPARKLVIESPVPVLTHAFTFDDRFLITCGADRQVRFWRTSDGKLDRTVELLGLHVGRIIELSPDGRTAVWLHATSDTGNLLLAPFQWQFLDLESGEAIGAPLALQPSVVVDDAVFSPDATRLAILDRNGHVTIIESRTGRVVSTTINHSSNLFTVKWSPDGRLLLTVGYGEEILAWNAETGTQTLGPLKAGGEKEIRRARWSPDGRFIVTYNGDQQLRVWDATTGESITPPLSQPDTIHFAFMTPNRRVIAAILPDQLRALDLQESPLPPDVLADYAKLLAGRQLNTAGLMLVLPAKDLAELDRSLRARALQLFE